MNMKSDQFYKFLLLVGLILGLILASCEESDTTHLVSNIVDEPLMVDYKKVSYPKLAQPVSRSINDTGFWESWTEITLNSGNTVNTPWNDVVSATTLPVDISNDIAYSSGWDLIINATQLSRERGLNYLIFHNRFTGILKVFYYLEDVYPNNNGFWKISTSTPSSLFAFSNEEIPLSTVKTTQPLVLSNLSQNTGNGFDRGWNCFQVELSYDSTQNGYLFIEPYNLNTTNVSYFGDFSSETEGSIITAKNSSNNTVNGVAKLFGNKASEWLIGKINRHEIAGVPMSVIQGGVSSLLSSAASSLIGSVVGVFTNNSSSSTSSSVQLLTKGGITLSGSDIFVSNGVLPNIRVTLNPDTIGYLGVWCLDREPEIVFSPYATLRTPQLYTNGYTKEYVSYVYQKRDANISINPDLLPYINSYSSVANYYQTDHITRQFALGNTTGTTAKQPPYISILYDDIYRPNEYLIADVAFKDSEGFYMPIDQFYAPYEVYLPNVPNGPQSATPNICFHSQYIVPVTVTLNTVFGNTAISVHRTIPTVSWNYNEFNNGLYWYMYPNEPVTTIQ